MRRNYELKKKKKALAARTLVLLLLGLIILTVLVFMVMQADKGSNDILRNIKDMFF